MSITGYQRIQNAFGLEKATHRFTLENIFRITGAHIGGSTALSWHMDDEILPEQDLDIFYTPSTAAPTAITTVLFNTLFNAAGYERRLNSTGSYSLAKTLNIDTVLNWYHPTLKRKIQVIVRSADAPTDRPAYGEADFDICQYYAVCDSNTGHLSLKYDPVNSAITSAEISSEIRVKRVMRIGNLKDQSLQNTLRRLSKYYGRGFAFETEHEAPCSCACGHEHTAKKVRRLRYSEAARIVRTEHARVNPVPTDSDDVDVIIPPPRPLVRPPPLEIPPFLEITDTLETPPRVKRIARPRLCRKDDSWIRTSKD